MNRQELLRAAEELRDQPSVESAIVESDWGTSDDTCLRVVSSKIPTDVQKFLWQGGVMSERVSVTEEENLEMRIHP